MSKNLSNSVLFGGKTVTNINEIDSAIDDKQPIMGDGVIETTPVEDSTRAVTSGGVFTQLGLKQGKIGDGSVETTPVVNSTRAVTSGGVFTALGLKQGKIGDGSVETTPVVNSTRAVTSGGVFTALATKQPIIGTTGAVDLAPTTNSTNAVISGGVFTALATKQDLITITDQLKVSGVNFAQNTGDPDVLPIIRPVEINPAYDATGEADGTFNIAPIGGSTDIINLDARLDIRGKGNNFSSNTGYQSSIRFSQRPLTSSSVVYKMAEIGCSVSVAYGPSNTFESRMDINCYNVAQQAQTFIRMDAEDNKLLLRAGDSNRITITVANTQIRNTFQLKATKTRNTPSGISDNVCMIECEKVTAGEESALHFVEFDSTDAVDSVYAGAFVEQSDIRIKTDIEPITDATNTLLKLKPKNYKKIKTGKESSGLIIQDIWYSCPELRHIIKQNGVPTDIPVGKDFSKINWTDYGWSEEMSSMNYNSLIPYLIKSNQELHTRIQKLEDMIIE